MNQNYYEEECKGSSQASSKSEKKNVLLIGDSIRCGYCEGVREDLSDIANVFFPQENCRNSQFIITSLYSWSKLCEPENIDIVHFNCGHWDIAHWNNEPYSLTDLNTYEHNIKRIITQTQKMFPNARVCFATTTPMHPYKKDNLNPRTNDEIREYNAAAVKVAKAEGVDVNDLFTLMKDRDDSYYLDYCHYTDDAYLILAKAVADFLRERL